MLLAGWNILFLRPDPWRPDPARDATWNRGAYLVEAIGHCGACHTPRNRFGAEQPAQTLAGGEAEHWYAPPLRSGSPARQPWGEPSLLTYLRTGFDAHHGAAAGPMTAVTDQLARVPEAELQAMAVYLASLMSTNPAGPATIPTVNAGVEQEPAQTIFSGACGGCHGVNAPMMRDGAPSLSLGSAVNAPTPGSVIQIILHGIPGREGKSSPYMPPFAAALTNAQVAGLAAYLRAAYSDKPPWSDILAEVARLRGQS